MKKTILITFAIISLNYVHAQVEKGSTLIGGSVNFNTNKSEISANNYTKSSSWNISPQVGKAIKTNAIVGIQLNAGAIINDYRPLGVPLSTKTTVNNYGLGVFYRQYYPLSGKWMLFGDGSIGGTISNGNTKSNDIKAANIKGWSASLNIMPGITYRVGKKVWLEAALNNLANISYSSQKTENLSTTGEVQSTNKQTSFGANASISGLKDIAIGLRWIL
ncbi:MAG: hypothetical protein QM791_06860 [Ferruginibacter sp.]